ncbi:MAG: CRISPR-associated helicase Cas3', partial [Bacilli bacterium]
MYFNKIILFNFRRLIRQDKPFYAHIGESLKPETLEMHLELSLKYFEKIYDEKNLENVFTRFEKSFLGGVSDNALALWKKLILNMIYCHDLGKINPNFQRLKMDNLQWELTETNNSRHSFFSALIFFSYYFEEVDALENEEEYNLLFMLLLILSFIISKHHSSLMNFMDFVEKLEDTFLEETFLEEKKEELEGFLKPYNEALMEKAFIKETYECIVENWQGKDPWQCVNWYVFGRFLYGLLVSCDFYATSEYVNKTPVEALGVINNIDRYLEVFNDNVITQKIRNMEFTKPEKPDINILRSQLFIETEEKLLKHFDEHIFFMEAPTGSGKTRASINLALQLLNKNHELNKITYVFPFNTLVEQTKASLCECFNNDPKLTDLIAVVNGITPIKKYLDDGQMSDEGEWSLEKGEKIDYERSLLARQFLHYPIVLTTHVNLFESLFGFKRESAFPVAHLANSVIVLDEIQSYNNAIWKEIIIFLKAYAKLLNIKIIIMSATLPDLNNLCHDKSATTYLVENRDVYFQNPLFKKRVNLDFSLLESDIKKNIGILSEKVIDVFKVLKERVNCSNKILIEFISKKSAFSFYELMCEQLELMNTEATVFLMTGDDNKAERKHIIDAVNGGKNLILVATQVIEAGIDIDMDVGFKDTSLLDAEEQFLGRIN